MPETPIILGYDPDTLRERVDAQAAEARLEEIAHLRSLAALNERVTLLRLLGRVDDAFEVAQAAYRQSRFTGAREDALAAKIRRAVVQHAQGKGDVALRDLDVCVQEARDHEWLDLTATALQHRGHVHFAEGDADLALADFEEALKIRESINTSADRVEASKFAVRVARARVEGTALPAEPAHPASHPLR